MRFPSYTWLIADTSGILIGTLLALMIFVGGNSHAASFDCKKAATPTELQICSNSELSILDDELANQYRTALAKSSNLELTKKQQREWLLLRDACGNSRQPCMNNVYQARIRELKEPVEASLFDFRAFSAGDGWVAKTMVFSSPTASALWEFIAGRLAGHESAAMIEHLRGRAMFARVGPGIFLAMLQGVYFVRPGSSTFELLTPEWLEDSYDLPSFRPIPGGRAWALIHASTLSSGHGETDFGAVFVGSQAKDKEFARYIDIARFAEIDDDPCDSEIVGSGRGAEHSTSKTVEHLDGYEIKDINNDSMDDVVVSVSKQDCATSEIKYAKRVFINTGDGFRELNAAEANRIVN